MKLSVRTGAALLLCSTAVLAAPDSCERVKRHPAEDHQQWRTGNRLQPPVPNDQADQPGVQVVGHCANDTFKITIRVTATVRRKRRSVSPLRFQ